jgi:hypothetical protein
MSRESIEEAIEVLEDASADMLMETGDKSYYVEAIAVLRQALVDANDTSQERVDETAKRKHIKTWNERCEEHPDHQERIISERMIQARMQEEIDELRQALVDDGGNCYGDGTVYRGQRSKDSAVQTLRLRTRARGEKLT